jgi:predicted CXXCH cytochrome family protein
MFNDWLKKRSLKSAHSGIISANKAEFGSIDSTLSENFYIVRKPLGLRLAQVVLWGTCIIPLHAAQHPTPLQADADTPKCLECHEEKSHAKSVHTAVSVGCLACHEVRVSNDITRIKLKTATVGALCLKCHENKKPVPGESPLHPPSANDCTQCHDPHGSPNKNHTLKPLSGGKSENLCLKCHATGLNVGEKGSRHAALDTGCDSCHVIHKTGKPGALESEFHQLKDPLKRCMECHDVKNEAIVKAHYGQPLEGSNCLSCHDMHQSSRPNLVQGFAHSPFAGKSCDICHLAPKDGKVVLTKPDSNTLCLSCHEEVGKKIQTAKIKHSGAKGKCIGCHDPHAGNVPGFLSPDPVSICTKCHRTQAKLQTTKAYLHKVAYKTGCSTCHEPHGGENDHLLRTSTPNALCLECHDSDPKWAQGKDDRSITIFNGSVKLPKNYFNTMPVISIKYGLGHPIDRHPVVDQMDPMDVTKVRAAINCSSCHQPHASSERYLLVKDQANNIMFCASCHKDMGK